MYEDGAVKRKVNHPNISQVIKKSYLIVILQHLCNYSDLGMIILDGNDPWKKRKDTSNVTHSHWHMTIGNVTHQQVSVLLISRSRGMHTSWCWRHLQHQDLHNICWQVLSRHQLTRSMCKRPKKKNTLKIK